MLNEILNILKSWKPEKFLDSHELIYFHFEI